MTLEGLDLSEYQTATPSLAGMAFVFARATYDCHPDAKFGQHMSAARMAGVVRGAYHFATGRSTAPAQASAFLNAAGDAHLLCVDFEQDAVPASSSLVSALIAAIKASDPKKRKVGLYHSESGFPELGQDFDWVAHWGVDAPTRHWAFHQYTSSGSVAGYTGRLDLDRFNGDLPALRSLAGIAAPVTPSVPATLGPRPSDATGWVAVNGSFFVWGSGGTRTSRAGRFSAWAHPIGLSFNGARLNGYQIDSGAYGPHGSSDGFRIFSGPAVAWHEVQS